VSYANTLATSILLYLFSLVILIFISRPYLNPLPRFLIKLIPYGLTGLAIYLEYNSGLIDDFPTLLAYTTLVLGYIIGIYSTYYFKLEEYHGRFDTVIDLFVILVAATYGSPNLISLAAMWSAAEIIGWYLIVEGEAHSIEGSLRSSRGYLLTSTLTFEISAFTVILVSILSVMATMASVDIGFLIKPFKTIPSHSEASIYFIPLLIVGFIAKTANIPLHFWLPGAHSAAPSPASAILSGLMTPLGFYGLYRVLKLVDLSSYSMELAMVLAILGFMSVIYGWIQVSAQRDGKKILAYATIATNGYISMVFALYVLNPSNGMENLLGLSILMHAAYKVTLFSEMGLIEASYRTRYIHGIRGLSKTLPLSSMGGLLAVLTLMGAPGTIGFTVKALSVYYIISQALDPARLLILVGFITYMAISAYLAVKYMTIYFSTPHPPFPEEPSEIPRVAQIPVLVLGLSNVYLPIVSIPLLKELADLILLFSMVSPLMLLATVLMYLTVARERGVKH